MFMMCDSIKCTMLSSGHIFRPFVEAIYSGVAKNA